MVLKRLGSIATLTIATLFAVTSSAAEVSIPKVEYRGIYYVVLDAKTSYDRGYQRGDLDFAHNITVDSTGASRSSPGDSHCFPGRSTTSATGGQHTISGVSIPVPAR